MNQKLYRKYYATLFFTVILLLLTISPAYAAPSLSLDSTTSYSLTGKVQATQSCTANPIGYASQACTGITSISAYLIMIVDDGKCPTNPPPNDPFAALRCRFDPNNLTVIQGIPVQWTNFGNLTHTVTSNQTANVGLPAFDSGNITRFGIFSHTFTQTGTYYYYDKYLGPYLKTMRGVVTVSPPPPPPAPPSPRSIQVGLSGAVGWSVEGLSSSEVNLLVSHHVGLSVSPFPFFSFTPLTESGSFEQSVNLSTRAESPSTATGLLGSLFASAIQALPGSTIASGTSGSLIQTILSAQSFGPDYTEWWVNGPLSSGSPVQISHGWSSVTGSESLDLGGSIGTRPAWIVTSQLNQTANLTIPNFKNILGPSTTFKAEAGIRLLWSFDKSADLLLRTNRTATLSMHSVTPMTIPAIGGTADVTITRDMILTIDVALVLSSTSLSLPNEASHASNLMEAFLALPWMTLGLAGLAAGGFAAILVRFTRKGKAASPGPAPLAAPPP